MGNDISRPILKDQKFARAHSKSSMVRPISLEERLQSVEKIVYEEIDIPEATGLLGYGASARVFKGMWKKTPVAVKRFFEPVREDEFANEALCQKYLFKIIFRFQT
jgi:hypothetical protein